MGLAVLLALSFLFLPDWIPSYISSLPTFFAFHSGPPRSISLPPGRLWLASDRVGCWLAACCSCCFSFGEMHRKSDFRTLLWTVLPDPVGDTPVGYPDGVHQIIPSLFLPLMLFLAILVDRKPWLKRWGAVGIVGLILLVGLWLLVLGLVRVNAYTALNNTLILLLPGLLVFGLMWMRWWFIHRIPIGFDLPG